MLIFQALNGLLTITMSVGRVVTYGYLIYFSLELVKSLPLEKYFKKVSWFHYLILSFIITNLAWSPLAYILDLLKASLGVFTDNWLLALISLTESLGLIYLLNKLFKQS